MSLWAEAMTCGAVGWIGADTGSRSDCEAVSVVAGVGGSWAVAFANGSGCCIAALAVWGTVGVELVKDDYV